MNKTEIVTYRIAKVVGLYLFTTGLGFFLSAPYYERMISHVNSDPVLINLSGMVHFFIGGTILALNFKWKTAMEKLVLILGIMYFSKGFFIIALPELTLQSGNNAAQVPDVLSYIWMTIGLVIFYFAFRGEKNEKKQEIKN
ncbi:hypothetical protein [Fusibacter ferrireducens]|uniref:DUF4383 domain-containing protein n=1 Tax=Fusibacter ferrireducens TaxID=2785058 RepID=A0ABR9ZM47_9FIRM|nr:hypothetical protein [Fusibacter ferrireducens]MBF4691496.1 hypothetical protein [Fusibacter ferrireducens]